MPTALEIAQRSITQLPSQPSLDVSSRLFTSGSPRPPSPPQLKISPALTTKLSKPKLPEKPTLTGPPAPPKLVGPPKPPKQESKEHKKIMKKLDSFNKFFSGFKKGAVTLYEPLYTPIKQGLPKVGDVWKPGTEGYKDFLEGSKLLGKGALKVGKAITIDTTPTVARGLKRIYKDPGILSTKRMSPYIVGGSLAAVGYASDFVKNPKVRGESAFYIADFLAPTGLLKGARLTDKAIRSGIIKLGAKEVPATELFAKQLFKEGKLSSTGIATTKESSSILSLFEKTKGKVKEYPEYLVAQSSLQAPLKDSKILTQAEKGMSGLKTRLEDPGFWVSPRGEGGTFYFRLAEEGTTPQYKFSLFPEAQKTGKPELLQILGKRAEALPESVLAKDVSFKTVADYQDFLAKTRPSTFIIPKRSEIAIGSRETKSLIKSIDPKVKGSPEIQAVIPQGVFLEEATKIKPRNFWSRLKGYSEFVKVGSESIPIRYKIISEAKNLIGDVKSVASKSRTTLSETIKKQADEFYSYYQSTKRPVYTIDVGRPASYGYFKASKPNYTQTSFTGSQPVYGAIKDSSSYTPDKPKPTDYTINKIFNDYIPPEPKPDDSYPEPPKPDDDTYPVVYRQDGDYPTKPTYDPTDFVPKYPTKPSLSTYNFNLKNDNTYKPNRILEYSRKDDYSKPQNLNQAFDVFVRSKGKWTKVKTKDTMNYFYAKAKGFEIADKYAERSVKLKPTKKTAKLIGVSEPFNSYKFDWDKSKKETLRKSYIEKSKYAIDSIGELRGITYKGLKATKTKKTKKKFSFL